MAADASQDRPFRFGVQLRSATSAREWRDKVRKAEDMGYAAATMPDHIAGQIAPLVGLAAAASVTSRIRLGTWVLANDFRHPAMLAKEAATLDLLSEGRLELGLGAGWMNDDYAKPGIPLDSAPVRISRLIETVKILRGLWGPGPFTLEGQHYRIRDLDGEPKPVQQPLPLQIGGGGKRILSFAAREAQIVGLAMRLPSGEMDADAGRSLTPEATDQKLEWIRAAAGARFAELTLNARVNLVAIGERAEVLGPSLGLPPEELVDSPHALIGPAKRVEEHLRSCRERWGLSYFVVSEAAMDSMAPLVARLTGT